MNLIFESLFQHGWYIEDHTLHETRFLTTFLVRNGYTLFVLFQANFSCFFSWG